MVERSVGDECIRIADGILFEIIVAPARPGDQIQLRNKGNGHIHWLSPARLKKKYKFVVPWKAEEVD